MTEETLFAKAIELPPEERAVFLNEACGDDVELRARIESLLHSHEAAGTFLAQSAEMDFDATLDISADDPELIVARSAELKEAQSAKEKVELESPIPAVVPDVEVIPQENVSGANPDSPVPFIFGPRIAQGAMGAILEADDCKFGRKIAVKVMLEEAGMSEDQNLRFIQEAAVLGRLEHPNIVPVHDLGRDGAGELYYSMKLVKGRTLQDVINDLRAENPEALAHYTLERLLTIFRKICDAMAFAHSENIIHRDLKPENIMVGEFGEVLVMDWGLSKILDGRAEIVSSADLDPNVDASGSASATLEGSVMGTPQYMSPEQAAGEIADMDARSDIYSLGAILYAILTLRPPVEGADVYEVLAKVQAGDLAPITAFETASRDGKAKGKGPVLEAKKIKPLPHVSGGRIPAALSAVAMKALSLAKAERYQDVAAFSADIEAYQHGFATSAEEAGLAKQLMLLIKRNKGIFTTAAAAWLLITALAVWFVFNLQAKERETRRQAEIARKAEAVAVQKEAETSKALARSAISLAEAALREGNGPAMQSALGDVPEDLRDYTWRYLFDESDSSIARIDVGAEIDSVAAHPRLPHVFAVADRAGKVTFVNVLTGEHLLEFIPVFSTGRRAQPCSLAISPDGERIVIGRTGKEGLLTHSTRDGRKLAEWDAPGTFRLEFDPNGGRLLQTAIHGNQFSLNLLDSSNGEIAWSYRASGNTPYGTHGVFTANGSEVVTYGFKDGFRVVNAADGSVMNRFKSDRGVTTAMAINVNGHLAVADRSGFLTVIDVRDGRRMSSFRAYHQPFKSLYFTPGGQIITADSLVDGRQKIDLWQQEDSEKMRTFLGGSGEIKSISIHPLSGELLLSGPETRAWALGGTAARWSLPGGNCRNVAFWETDNHLFAPSPGNGMALWALEGKEPAVLWNERTFTPTVSVTQDGRHALIGIKGAPPLVRDARSKTPGVIRMHFPNSPRRVRLSPGGDRVAVIDLFGRKPEVYETSEGAQTVALESDGLSESSDMGWLNGGKHLVGLATAVAKRGMASSEERIVLWDTTTGKILRSVTNDGTMDVLTVSPDGESFAEAGGDKRVRIRDAETLAVLQEFRAHDAAITALAWHPTRPVLATAATDLNVRLWDLETGRRLEDLRGPILPPEELAFSPGGQRLACTSTIGSTQVWDPPSLRDDAEVPLDIGDEVISENTWFSDPISDRTPKTKIKVSK